MIKYNFVAVLLIATFSLSGFAAECNHTVNGQTITGVGTTKNLARSNASQICMDIKLDEYQSQNGGQVPTIDEAETILFAHCLNICQGS
jgi:hypothetical protein